MDFFIPIIQSIIANKIDQYLLQKLHDKSPLFSKGDTIEEQFVYCIDKALMMLGKKYGFEYNIDIRKSFLENLIGQGEIFSNESLTHVLSEIVDLEFGEDELKEWFSYIDRIISEEQLNILRDYIIIQSAVGRNKKVVYPQILTAKPPLPPEEYLDRNERKAIIEKLNTTKKMVLVNGIGGIGKSTVCRRIFHDLSMDGRPLAWVVYNDKNLLDDLKKQLFYPKAGQDWEKRFTQFIEQDIDENAILFIDNLNATEEEEQYLSKLSNAKCSVVCTSRIEKFAHYEIIPIAYFDEEKCIELFYKYYKREYDEKRIRNIITKAGNHTLVIEILGKIANAENYTLEELENKLDRDGFDLEGIASVENKEDTLIGHLCKTFNTEKLNDIQKAVLYCLSVLPVQWIPDDFKRWLGLENSYNINYLVKYAWFECREKKYYMHPVVKEVVKRMIPMPENIVLRLLDGIAGDIAYKENPDKEKSRLLISFAEAVLKILPNEKNYVISQTLYNLSVLYAQFGEMEQAEAYITDCVEIEEAQNNSEGFLADAYNHWGYIEYYLYKDAEAEKKYMKAYRLRIKLKNFKQIAATESNLALLYQGIWNQQKKGSYLYKAARYQRKAIRTFEHIFRGKKHSNLASAYNNMGVIYYDLHRYDEAVFYYKKAEMIRIKLNRDISPGDLSVTYKGLCDGYFAMAHLERTCRQRLICCKMALIYLNKALNIREDEIRAGNQKWEVDELLETRQKLEEKMADLRKELY